MLQNIQSYANIGSVRYGTTENFWGCRSLAYLLNQIERTYKKMNEYLIEMELSTEDNLSDEEIMIVVSNRKLHTNRKKNKKENYIYGKESNYNLYC